jgi:hypothetical protein
MRRADPPPAARSCDSHRSPSRHFRRTTMVVKRREPRYCGKTDRCRRRQPRAVAEEATECGTRRTGRTAVALALAEGRGYRVAAERWQSHWCPRTCQSRLQSPTNSLVGCRRQSSYKRLQLPDIVVAMTRQHSMTCVRRIPPLVLSAGHEAWGSATRPHRRCQLDVALGSTTARSLDCMSWAVRPSGSSSIRTYIIHRRPRDTRARWRELDVHPPKLGTTCQSRSAATRRAVIRPCVVARESGMGR